MCVYIYTYIYIYIHMRAWISGVFCSSGCISAVRAAAPAAPLPYPSDAHHRE